MGRGRGWHSNNANKPGQSASARGLHMTTQTPSPSPSLRGAAAQGWLGARGGAALGVASTR